MATSVETDKRDREEAAFDLERFLRETKEALEQTKKRIAELDAEIRQLKAPAETTPPTSPRAS